jgi:capsular exopolysaccharide synthesis family protein
MTQIPAARGPGQVPALWSEQQVPLYGTQIQDVDMQPTESRLRHYWRILYRRRWVALSILAACIGFALIASMLTQRQYTATARIQIAREVAKVMNIEGVENEEGAAASAEFYQTQYALLKSRSLAEAVVRSLGLSENYQFLADYDMSEAESIRELPRAERFALATEKVDESTAVAPVRGSSVVDVHVEVPNPQLAASIANELVEKFIETNLSRRFEATAYAREFLQNRLNSVRAKLEDSERRATEYARQQGLITIASSGEGGETSGQQSLTTADLAQLSSQLALARAQRARAEADFRASSGGAAAERARGNEAVNALRRQRAELTGELRKLESDFGPEYPRVVALRAQLNELNRQIAQEEGVVRSGVNRDLEDRYRQALAAERGLQSRVDQLKAAVLDQQQRSIQFNIIQRDVDTNRALYEALLQRFKEIGVAGGIGTNNVSVVDPALPPEDPSSPNLPLNLALGLIFGLALGAGAAFALEQLAESVILPSEFQRKLGLPLLGSTPITKTEGGRKLLGTTALTTRDVTNKLGESQSELSEAYFSILTAIQFSTPKGAPKTLSVTSSQAGEGKSTTALALAKALASVGARVLIIDADMRNPSLHKALGLQSGRGLSDVLTGKAELMEVAQTADGISAIPAGPLPPNPAELLASGALEEALRVAGENFDHVVLDGPPVLGLADAPLIARATEGTVFVVESGRTRSTQARQAIERLIRVRAHLLGAVLTKLDSRSSGYGYGYGYNYSYGNG